MAQKQFTYGFTLGKFMPPHKGHLQLIEEAEKYVEQLFILVGTLEREPIPGDIRFQWMKELNPKHTVIHISEDLPGYPHEHPDFWKIWVVSVFAVRTLSVSAAVISAPFNFFSSANDGVVISANAKTNGKICFMVFEYPVGAPFDRHLSLIYHRQKSPRYSGR